MGGGREPWQLIGVVTVESFCKRGDPIDDSSAWQYVNGILMGRWRNWERARMAF